MNKLHALRQRLPGYEELTGRLGVQPRRDTLTMRAWLSASAVVFGGLAVILFVLTNLIPLAVLMALAAVVAFVDVYFVLQRIEREEKRMDARRFGYSTVVRPQAPRRSHAARQ